jgi:MoaA/NifB/PqqE/SkfB family radical SAM enzyme
MLIRYNGDVIPCANYRIGEQNARAGDKRVIGNVFQTSVRDVWNSPGYRAIRRLVSNPERARRESWLRDSFCDGCAAVFDKDCATFMRSAERYQFEELYDLRGKAPFRRMTPARELAVLGRRGA